MARTYVRKKSLRAYTRKSVHVTVDAMLSNGLLLLCQAFKNNKISKETLFKDNVKGQLEALKLCHI